MAIKFLIVDDSKAMQTIVRRILSNAGYQDSEFQFADNGAQALEKIISWKPDMVLLDWHMPKMTGIELLHKVNELEIDTRIGLITAERHKSSIQEAMAAGAMFVVNKPFTVNSLKEKLIPALAGVYSMEDKPIILQNEIILPSPSAISLLLSTITDTKIKVEKIDPIKVDQLKLPGTLALYGDCAKNIKSVQLLDSDTADRLAEAFASSVFKGEAFDDKLLAKSMLKAFSIIAVCFHNVAESQELNLIKTYSMQQVISKIQLMDKIPAEERIDLRFTFDDDFTSHSIICLESKTKK